MNFLKIAFAVMLSLIVSVTLFAKPPEGEKSNSGNQPRKAQFKKIDKNKDGKIGKRESRSYKKHRSKVNKKRKYKADRNKDGRVDKKEKRAYKKHRSRVNKPLKSTPSKNKPSKNKAG